MKKQSKANAELERIQTEIKEKKDYVEIEKKKIEISKRDTTIGLIYSISSLLSILTVDDEATMPGSDTKYKSTFTEKELQTIKTKLFKVLEEI